MTARREYTQLAQTYDRTKHMIAGWFASEKLDGMRAFWDGGWSRGMLCSQVPYANTEKDHRLVKPPFATGLWSRYGNVINAPKAFLDALPRHVLLDGELYLGPNRFQELMSIVKRHQPDLAKWAEVSYNVFDLPSDYMFLSDGKVNNPNCHVQFDGMQDLFMDYDLQPKGFQAVAGKLVRNYDNHEVINVVTQYRLPNGIERAADAIEDLLIHVLDSGGEGIMLRKPESIWTPKRSSTLLKLKPALDDEAEIVGYVGGTGHMEGLMGSLIVTWEGKTFDVRGKIKKHQCDLYLGTGHYRPEPEERVFPSADLPVKSRWFEIGMKVTFRYRGLTDDGLPKEARYIRRRPLA